MPELSINLFKSKIFDLTSHEFEEAALSLFRFQATHNPVYREYIHYLNKPLHSVRSIEDIPFLPIGLFKSHDITIHDDLPQTVFRSSGTTGQSTSKHYIYDPAFYLDNTQSIFEHFYGSLTQYNILALLPSYLERNDASLVKMADFWMQQSGQYKKGFYMHDIETLMREINQSTSPVLLLGVTFALLDLADHYTSRRNDLLIMETGGMKGRRKEMIRTEVHELLHQSFPNASIHSEYGMTELMSQAYCRDGHFFEPPPWMRFLKREADDPLSIDTQAGQGAINIIDLANTETCAFIATDDQGRFDGQGNCEVLGRLDNSDIRGCNLLFTP